MTRRVNTHNIAGKWRSRLPNGLAVIIALGLGSYAMFGPNGLIAIGDHKSALAEREAELERLDVELAALQNRVDLLDPDNVDPDLGGELIRKELGVVAPSEIVIPLD